MRRTIPAAALLAALALAAAGCGDNTSPADEFRDSQRDLRTLEAEQDCARYAEPDDREACRSERGLD